MTNDAIREEYPEVITIRGTLPDVRCYDINDILLDLDLTGITQTQKEITDQKWADYYKYCDIDIPKYSSDAGNTFVLTSKSLRVVEVKEHILISGNEILWIEDDSQFLTDKVELLEVLKEAEDRKQTKLELIFAGII